MVQGQTRQRFLRQKWRERADAKEALDNGERMRSTAGMPTYSQNMSVSCFGQGVLNYQISCFTTAGAKELVLI